MTDDWIKLGKRAVACKGWRWMPGMSNSSGEVIDCLDVETGKAYCGEWDADITALPDFQDPATLGCLLALVREAWRCVVITSPDYDEDEVGCQGWHVTGWRAVETVRWLPIGVGGNEAEALVAALEGAP